MTGILVFTKRVNLSTTVFIALIKVSRVPDIFN